MPKAWDLFGAGFTESRETAHLVLLQPKGWGACTYDEVLQELRAEVLDEEGRPLLLALSHTDENRKAIDGLEAAAQSDPPRILGSLHLRRGLLAVEPISLIRSEGVLSLGLDGLAAAPASAATRKPEEDTDVPDNVDPDEEDDRSFDHGAIGAHLSAMGAELESLAEGGSAAYRNWVRLRGLLQRTEELGMSVLSGSLRRLLDAGQIADSDRSHAVARECLLETTSTGGLMGTSGGSSGAASTSGEPPAVCGETGVVEGDEECDDPGDTRCFECVRDRLVFVTSEDVQGDFWTWSPQNLDYLCNHLAAVAGLITDNKLRFKTWISTSEESAAERVFHSRGRYVLRNGLVFAESWDALMAQQILNPLNVDENGQTRNIEVLTDTRPDGTAMPGSHCDDWQSDSFDTLVYWGLSAATDANWTLYVGDATNPVSCDIASALYCFESP